MTVLDATTTIADFFKAAADKVPVPGGGAIAALSGAAATSMVEMVVSYSIGRKSNDAEAEKVFAIARPLLLAARVKLLDQITRDQQAYLALQASWKLPVGDPAKALAEAAAIGPPEAIAQTMATVMHSAVEIIPIANPNLLSDLAVALDIGAGVVRSAVHNIRINLKGCPADDAAQQEAHCRKLEADADRLAREGVAAVRQRAGF